MKTINDIKIGDAHSIQLPITVELVEQFAKLTGDYNPLHMDAGFAKGTVFGQRVVHGMLTGSFVSTMIGMHLPGPGALWLGQQYDFLTPVHIGDVITLHAEVIRKSESQDIIFLKIEGFNQKGMMILKGESKVKVMGEAKKMVGRPINECKILVTGASRGLGAAIALNLAAQGATVFANYKSSLDAMQKVVDSAKGSSGKIIPVAADITDEAGIKTLVEKAGAVDIVILNAVDNFKTSLFLEQDMEDFEKALDFGMRSPVRILKAFLPGMVERKFGRVVSILSTASVGVPPAGFSSYNVNKKALEAITKSIAVEYGKHNICANMVSPNMLRTDLTADVAERAKQILEAQTPLKRLATVEEVAANVAYLCSPAAAYVNGHNLILSGGSTII